MRPVGHLQPLARRRSATNKRSTSVAAAVARFALTGAAALALLTFAGIQLLQHLATSEAIRDSQRLTRLAGRGIVAPYITPALLAERPSAVNQLDQVVRMRLLFGPIVRVKIWDAAGRIVYSDQPRLIGSTYPLGDDEAKALRTRSAHAEVSNLSRPENRFERGYKKLLEVYLGLRATDGTPVLFEIYQRFSSIAASGQRLWKTFFPPLIATMILLELAQIPVAVSLARKLRRGQQEREQLLRRTIEASELERRRIARDLHDGPVQELAGVSYTLTAAGEQVRAGGQSEVAATLHKASRQTRESIRALRTLLVGIYPPRLHSEGLGAALSDLVAPLAAAGIEVDLNANGNLSLPPETEAVLFRAAQESLRNVLRHADARRVSVRVYSPDGHVTLDVEDDGRGFAPDEGTRDGHFGLRLLEDLARDADGRLTLHSEPGAGTSIRVEIPLP